jgi:Leucine-rich repeat (LRR) protein
VRAAVFPRKGRFSQTSRLSLTACGLTRVPASVSLFAAVTVLSLRENRITQLCAALFELRGLQELDLTRNELGPALDARVGRLSCLHTLLLGHNRLRSVPPEVCRLRALRNVCLLHNPLPAALQLNCYGLKTPVLLGRIRRRSNAVRALCLLCCRYFPGPDSRIITWIPKDVVRLIARHVISSTAPKFRKPAVVAAQPPPQQLPSTGKKRNKTRILNDEW